MSNKELLEALKDAHSKVKRTESGDARQVTLQSAEVNKPTRSSGAGGMREGKISDKTLRKLEKIEGSHWTPEQIVASLVDELPEVFPEIQLGEEILCPGMVYRRLERKGTVLCVDSGKMRYQIVSRKRGERYRAWMSYYLQKGIVDRAEQSMSMCIYELESYLLDFDDYLDSGWVKVINPEQYELMI